MKKLTILCLLIALLTSMSSCTETVETAETTADTDADAAVSVEETSPYVEDDLPETMDYNGRTATFYIGDYMNAFWNDFYAEASNGERLNDAIFESIQAVNERLNVSLTHIQDTFNWPVTDHTNRITNLIMAGDNSFDVLFSVNNFVGEQLTSPYFVNLAETPHVDLTKPWYNQSIPEALPNEDVWFIIGDAGLGNVKHTFCVFFNSDLLAANGIDTDLYAMVDDGTWTLDAFSEIIVQGYVDVNGDTVQDPDDIYGLTFGDANKITGFYPALDVKIASRSDSGYTLEYGNERAVNAVDTLRALVNENTSVAPIFANNADHPEWQIPTGGGNYGSINFIAGKSMMSCSLICDAATIMPEIDFGCGIVPYPKYNESQKDYQSFLQRSCYSLIPSTADTEFSGALLEAWSSQAYRLIMPEYFETALKTRYSQDNDMGRMFDRIRSSITYDPGEIFASFLGTPSGLFRDAIYQNKSDWSSTIKSNETKWQSSLDDLWNTVNAD